MDPTAPPHGRVPNVLQRVADRYPRQVTLSGNLRVTLSLMGEQDVGAVVDFARTFPPDDLMFLRVNITERPMVQYWVESIKAGRMITILAKRDAAVLGEATLRHHEATWTRHLGEIRLLIAPVARRRGLARLLAHEIETIARQLGLRLLTARMTLDQASAQTVFRQLGFQREAVLWDYAITPDNSMRNVLIATKRL